MSGSLAAGFLKDIVANIDDDFPRLVFADWLEENGHLDRAEFVRVQVERARLPDWDARQVRLRLREKQLLDQHGEEWLSELPTIEGAKWEGFRRGIVAEVSFASFEAMRQMAHACRETAPVEAITVRWPRRGEEEAGDPIAELRELSLTGRPNDLDEIAALADSPQLATLRVLTARGLWAEGLARFVESPHLEGVEVLRLPSSRNLGNDGIRALMRAASLTSLEELDLAGWGAYQRYTDEPVVQSEGVEALATWSGLAGVRKLNLSDNSVGNVGLRTLLHSPHARTLKELTVRSCRLDAAAVAEFRDAPPSVELETLNIGENFLEPAGLQALTSARCLANLKSLHLDRCEILLVAAPHLANAPFLAGLRVLDLGHNHFGPEGLRALLDRAPEFLHTLRLRDNDLFANGVALLAASPASNTLLELDLSQNGLADTAAETLVASPHLRELRILSLLYNSLSRDALRALAGSPLGQRLGELMPEWNVQTQRPSGDDIPF